MSLPWESSTADESWSQRDAWRGDLHLESVDAWREGCEDREETFVDDEEAECLEEPEEYDLDSGWPENLAGPEYWMFKRDCDD